MNWEQDEAARWQTATHEAGHAVVAERCGGTIRHVSAEPNAVSSGRIVADGFGTALDEALYIAGGVAADLEFGVTRPGFDSAADDRPQAAKVLPGVPFDVLVRAARDLIRAHKPAVELIARNLFNRRTLTGAEAHRLIRLATLPTRTA